MMLDLKKVHEVRRVNGMLERIQYTVKQHSTIQLQNIANIQNELMISEKRLTLEAISNATPEEILRGASRLASLMRMR